MTSPNADALFADHYRDVRKRLSPMPRLRLIRPWSPPAVAKIHVPMPAPAHLTPTQQAILARLIYSPIPVPADSLAFGVDGESVRVHVHGLRRAVEPRGVTITVAKGRGYSLAEGCRDDARRILEAQP